VPDNPLFHSLLPLQEVVAENGVTEDYVIIDATKFLSHGLSSQEPFSLFHEFRPFRAKKDRILYVKAIGLEPIRELTAADFGKYRLIEANVVSCRLILNFREQENGEQVITSFYGGVVVVGTEKFRYHSKFRIEPGKKLLLAWPRIAKTKKGLRPVLDVLAVERPREFPVTLVPKSLDDLRNCYPNIVGEDVNVKLALLALASRLNLDKDFWVMGIVVQGERSSGKSYFVANVLEPFAMLNRVEEFTRFTGAYLERKFVGRNMDNIILVIYEMPEDAPQQLHLTLSEGKLRVGIIDRETGEPHEFAFEGLPFLFSTTPLEGLRPDIRERVIVTSIDESDEQTSRIIAFQTRKAADYSFAERIREEKRRGAEAIAGWFANLKPAYVVIPWAAKLKETLSFMSVKLRRDWRKFLALIQASALLFQHDRVVIEREGKRVVFADRRDLENVLSVMPAFSQTLQNVNEVQRFVLDLMDPNVRITWTVRDIAKLAIERGKRVTTRRLRQVLEELEALGYIAITRQPGKENLYEKIADYEKVDFARILDQIDVYTSPEHLCIHISPETQNDSRKENQKCSAQEE
jgi:hypothetical protein